MATNPTTAHPTPQRADGERPLLKPHEVAFLLGVSANTVRRMGPDVLEVWTTPGGHRRYYPSDVDALIEAGA